MKRRRKRLMVIIPVAAVLCGRCGNCGDILKWRIRSRAAENSSENTIGGGERRETFSMRQL